MRVLRVLIVEDEPLIAMSLHDILIDARHIIVGTASRMSHALILAEQSKPIDLAILDIDLAGDADGIETARRLKHDHCVGALFVSAQLYEESRARSLHWKPHGFVSKPYRREQVLAAVDRIDFG